MNEQTLRPKLKFKDGLAIDQISDILTGLLRAAGEQGIDTFLSANQVVGLINFELTKEGSAYWNSLIE